MKMLAFQSDPLPEWLRLVIEVSPAGSVFVAIVAAAIAGTSLGIAISGRNTARKSLKIAERAEARIDDKVEIYLVKAKQAPAPSGYSIHVDMQIVNRSHSAIWLRKGVLWIEYEVGSRHIRNEVSPAAGTHVAFTFPLELKARQVVAGSLQFDVEQSRTGGAPILKQSLALTDTDGHEWLLADVKAGP